MTNEQRIERALRHRAEGYNCAQCMILAFDDIIGVDAKPLVAGAAPFGSGFSATGGLCGVVAGLAMVDSYLHWHAPADKAMIYARGRQIKELFEAENGCSLCSELKRNHISCPDLISGGITLYCDNML